MSKSISKASIELNENENDLNNTNNKKDENKYRTKTIINRNRLHSDFGHNLSYNKKLENELDTLPNETSKFFRKSLNKYKFQLEVYVPNSMVISKKEYYDKNYMLNNLVRIEDIIKSKKTQVSHISKETKKFSRQYELVKNENMNHQIDYLSKIENIYKSKGFNITGVNYKKDDNIFNPSFLLDTRYGNNTQTDAVKYGQNNYKKEYKVDKWLLNKFEEFIHNRNKGNKRNNTNESKRNVRNEYIIDDADEKQKVFDQVKKEIKEQIKIQNMSRNEYLTHSNQIKKEIEYIKNTINSLGELNESPKKNKDNYNNYNNYNKNISKSIEKDISKNSKEIKITDDSNNNSNKSQKKKKKIIDFNSNIFLSSKGTQKNNSKEKSQYLPEISKSQSNNIKYKIINKTQKKRLTKKYIKLNNNKIPKLLLKDLSQKDNKKEPIYLSERQKREMQKEAQLTQLYEQLSNKTNTFNFPYNQVNQYFTKYTPKKLPTVNTDRGSNFHGLVEDAQKIINENNIAGFVKLNNNAKRDINNNKFIEKGNKKLDDDYIINLDNKILGIHYDLTDKILSNKKEKIIID